MTSNLPGDGTPDTAASVGVTEAAVTETAKEARQGQLGKPVFIVLISGLKRVASIQPHILLP